ncbi:MAG TPA: AmmeMemoRadiSam system protein A [Candidatus Polarisedimenticolia bacterium]|nr:AmmeMemoRadiSam system protein A [Candidatus Polarisedimenticolia bacterium]
MSPVSPGAVLLPLTDEEGERLLVRARAGVASAAAGIRTPPPPWPLPASFAQPRDVFVTLTQEGRLRGCLGTWKAGGTLLDNLDRAARGAACDDPRFAPLEHGDVERVAIEVTVLDPPVVIDGPGGLTIGRHGVSVTHRSGRGLLLPQVAVEHGLGAEEFLRLACRKAGLPPDAWRRDAILEAFPARVFSESRKDPAASTSGGDGSPERQEPAESS